MPIPTADRPEDVGLSYERLARITRHLADRYVQPGKISGALTLVARGGKVAFLDIQGQRDIERGLPLEEDTLFRIYSMSKPITSVALMALYEEGHFQLLDPVHKFIPEFRDLRVYSAGNYPAFATVPMDRPMQFRDLLTHTSGLTYGFMERTNVDRTYRRLGIGGGGGGTLRDMIEKLATIPLEFSPGQHFNYSVSTDVCGYLVEQISGKPFDAFLSERIFEPLGMIDTGFHVPPAKADRFAANYTRERKALKLEDDPQTSPYLSQPSFLSGGGGLVSTAADYLRFCEMMRRGGELDGERILSRKTIELMTTNHLPGGKDLTEMDSGVFSESASEGTGFGLGFSVNLGPGESGIVGSAGEYAWGGAASTIFWIDPAEELVVIFMTQLMPSRTFNFRGQLKNLVYGAFND